MDIHTDALMRSYELLSNEAAYPSTPGKTHDMGNGKVSLKHKHLQSIQDRYELFKIFKFADLEYRGHMRQMHASGPILEL